MVWRNSLEQYRGCDNKLLLCISSIFWVQRAITPAKNSEQNYLPSCKLTYVVFQFYWFGEIPSTVYEELGKQGATTYYMHFRSKKIHYSCKKNSEHNELRWQCLTFKMYKKSKSKGHNSGNFFLAAIPLLHAHLHIVIFLCVKFHWNSSIGLGGVAMTMFDIQNV